MLSASALAFQVMSCHNLNCVSTISRNLPEARKEVKGIAKVNVEVISQNSKFIKFHKIIETTMRPLFDGQTKSVLLYRSR